MCGARLLIHEGISTRRGDLPTRLSTQNSRAAHHNTVPHRASVNGGQGFVSCPHSKASRVLPTRTSGRLDMRRAPYTLHPEEHRTGFEPAVYLLGRQAGSRLPNRCIINLVEVSQLHPGDEHRPIAAAEPHHRIRMLRVADQHLTMLMCHLDAGGGFTETGSVPFHLDAGTGFAPAASLPRTVHEGHAGFEPTTPPWQGGMLPTTPVAHWGRDKTPAIRCTVPQTPDQKRLASTRPRPDSNRHPPP